MGEHPEDWPPALTIPSEEADDYRQLAATADLVGKAIVDLVEAAKALGAPDPATLGAEGADWANFGTAGSVLRAWARLVAGNLPERTARSGLLLPPSGPGRLILPPGVDRH
jgi:hypothetical protein